ncbi:MAG TPA: ACP phosphodiesterase [Chitinophagaceae bacterium]|nr:DUF479 domain-containing protein [Chitinophagaceae bacterium]HQV06309.1 ACP phosphodiesterase [Chitinophagaceae bacterium]
MISDFVKGKKKNTYPVNIQRGILLHRLIDRFTDIHEATKEAKLIFQPKYRLYSGAFVDVVYDYYLANDASYFTENSLFQFSQEVYQSIDTYEKWLEPKFASFYPYMKKQNWLYAYRTPVGIQKSMAGLARRAKYIDDSQPAFQLFEKNNQLLEDCSRHFLADVVPFAFKKLTDLLEQESF